MDVYEWLRGPMAWFALTVFILGSLYQIIHMLLLGKRKRTVYPTASLKGGIRSFLHGVHSLRPDLP